jgi:hypothetical protein
MTKGKSHLTGLLGDRPRERLEANKNEKYYRIRRAYK